MDKQIKFNKSALWYVWWIAVAGMSIGILYLNIYQINGYIGFGLCFLSFVILLYLWHKKGVKNLFVLNR